MDIDPSGFLWLEEHKLVLFLIKEQEAAIAWDLCEWEKTLTVMGSWVSMYEEESHRLPGQKSAHLITHFKTNEVENCAIKEGLVIAGKRVWAR